MNVGMYSVWWSNGGGSYAQQPPQKLLELAIPGRSDRCRALDTPLKIQVDDVRPSCETFM